MRRLPLLLLVLMCTRSAAAADDHDHEHPHVAPREIVVVGEGPPRSASESSRDRRVLTVAPHRTAADVLRAAPGVFLTQHSGAGKAYQIFYRGFDAVHGQDVAIDVGGVPVNEVSNIHGQGYADLHFVMPEVVRALRSTPGTYAPWQGDFAVAGSIRVTLGYDEPGVTAKAAVGSFGERRTFLAYHPSGADPATFGAFEAHETNGFGPARAASRTSAIGQHAFALGHGVVLRVLATAYGARFDSPGVLLRSDVPRDRFATYDPRQGGASSRASLLLDLSHAHRSDDGLEHGTWSLAPFIVMRSLRLRQNFTGFLVDPVHGDATEQLHDVTTLGATALYRRGVTVFSPSDLVELGLYLRSDLIDQSQRALSVVDDRVLSTSVDARLRATNAAGFLDLSLKPLKRVTLRGGVRVDGLAYSTVDHTLGGHGRSAAGTHVGPKLTVDARVAGALHVVASYGHGFRSPQARALADGERAPFTRVRSFELGLRYQEPRALTASLAAFHTRLSDDLVFDPTTARNEAVPATARTGGALEYVLTPTEWFVSSGSATVTVARFTGAGGRYVANETVPYVPRVVLRQDVAFTPVLARVGRRELRGRIGAALSGLASRPLPYGARGADIFLVDASVGARLGEVELRVDALNLLDAKWFDSQFLYPSQFHPERAPSLLPAEHVTVGAPRTLLATLSVYL